MSAPASIAVRALVPFFYGGERIEAGEVIHVLNFEALTLIEARRVELAQNGVRVAFKPRAQWFEAGASPGWVQPGTPTRH